MIDLEPIYQYDSKVLLLAPTAWGKTTLLLELIKSNQIVYISPLRALADEFEKRCISSCYNTKRITGRDKNNINDFDVLIMSAELFDENILEKLSSHDCIFIFDEFHLFYYWGESFRPKLKESLELVLMQESKVLAMSATCEKNVLDYWSTLNNSCSFGYIFNIGNHQIKTLPKTVYIFRQKSRVFDLLETPLDGVNLIFCKYRNEVKQLSMSLRDKGFSVNECVSSQVDKFNSQMHANPSPNYIIATSTLSHGVNLLPLTGSFLLMMLRAETFSCK